MMRMFDTAPTIPHHTERRDTPPVTGRDDDPQDPDTAPLFTVAQAQAAAAEARVGGLLDSSEVAEPDDEPQPDETPRLVPPASALPNGAPQPRRRLAVWLAVAVVAATVLAVWLFSRGDATDTEAPTVVSPTTTAPAPTSAPPAPGSVPPAASSPAPPPPGPPLPPPPPPEIAGDITPPAAAPTASYPTRWPRSRPSQQPSSAPEINVTRPPISVAPPSRPATEPAPGDSRNPRRDRGCCGW